MRKALFLALAITLLSSGAGAAAPPALPEGAQATQARLMTKVGPETRAWLRQAAARLGDAPTEADARAAVRGNRALAGLGDADVDALAFLVMLEAAKSAREDVREIMAGVERINDAKAKLRGRSEAAKPARRPATRVQAPRTPDPIPRAELDARLEQAKNDLDSMSEMGEMESLRLQMAMDRLSKMMSTLSNLLKKASETAQGITQNLK
jgi:hypothetical protein